MAALLLAWFSRLGTDFNAVRLLRPVLLVTSSNTALRAVGVFHDTIKGARVVFLLLLTLVSITAVGYTLLFKGVYSEAAYDSTIVDSFLGSVIDMFMLTIAGDNYQDALLPALRHSKAYVLFVLPVAFVGVFFVMAVVIGAFEESFNQYKQDMEAMTLRQSRFVRATLFALWTFPPKEPEQDQVLRELDFIDLLKRVDATAQLRDRLVCSCFMLMDQDQSGTLDFEEFDDYFICCNIVAQIRQMKRQIALLLAASYCELELEAWKKTTLPW